MRNSIYLVPIWTLLSIFVIPVVLIAENHDSTPRIVRQKGQVTQADFDRLTSNVKKEIGVTFVLSPKDPSLLTEAYHTVRKAYDKAKILGLSDLGGVVSLGTLGKSNEFRLSGYARLILNEADEKIEEVLKSIPQKSHYESVGKEKLKLLEQIKGGKYIEVVTREEYIPFSDWAKFKALAQYLKQQVANDRLPSDIVQIGIYSREFDVDSKKTPYTLSSQNIDVSFFTDDFKEVKRNGKELKVFLPISEEELKTLPAKKKGFF